MTGDPPQPISPTRNTREDPRLSPVTEVFPVACGERLWTRPSLVHFRQRPPGSDRRHGAAEDRVDVAWPESR